MDITRQFSIGKEIAPGFKVIKAGSRPVMADMANPITEFVEVKLDCLYENLAILAFATFMHTPPPEQWLSLSLTGKESNRQLWQPQKIRQECIGIDYNKRGEAGNLIAISQLITTKHNTLVSAQLLWFGFPFINRFYVGIKPGMRERAEELLSAGLKFA